MRGSTEPFAVLMAALLTVSLVGMVAALGAGSAGAVHPEDAPDYTEEANFTANFPYATDHYPGDQNEENGSAEYFAAGEDAFHEQDASEGVFIDWIIVHAEYEGENWIDYSACDVDNTETFGIDRGNNNSGTNYDDDLLQHRKDDEFRDDGVVVEFYDWEDIPEDPPYMAPEDAIVAAQGAGSAGGPCLTLTDEPGWYRIAGYMNGTVADNGPDQEPSEDADRVEVQLQSNYLYVCECDSEEEAREELGPPPSEDGGDDGAEDDGAEDDGAEDDGAEDDGAEDDGAEDDGAEDDGEATETEADDGAEDDGEATETEADDGATDEEDDGTGDDGADDGDQPVVEDDGETTDEDQPGFGALAALVALLASALLLYRRG